MNNFVWDYFLVDVIQSFFWLTLADDIFQPMSINVIVRQCRIGVFLANFGLGYFLADVVITDVVIDRDFLDICSWDF